MNNPYGEGKNESIVQSMLYLGKLIQKGLVRQDEVVKDLKLHYLNHITLPGYSSSKDKNEITVVIDQSKIKGKRTPSKNIIKIDEDWRLLTFDLVLPFNLVGFIAKISKVLADADISIFVTSAFSTDHILVKNKNLKKTINKLKSLGFKLTFS